MNKTIVIALCVVAACDGEDRNGRRPEVDASPHLAAKSCDLPKGDTSTVARVGGTLGKVEVCWVFADGTVRVELDATPRASLTIGGVKQTVPDDGHVDATIELDPALLRAPVASAIGDGAGITAPPVALELDPPGAAPIKGTLEVSLGDAAARRTRTLLAALPSGAPLPRGTNPPAIVRGSMVVMPAEEYAPLTTVGKPATLGQLDLVAIVKDGAHHAAAECGPYDNFGMLPHEQLESIVTVYEAATGAKVDEHTFADGYEDCSMFVSGYAGQKPTVESRVAHRAIDAWLAGITSAR